MSAPLSLTTKFKMAKQADMATPAATGFICGRMLESELFIAIDRQILYARLAAKERDPAVLWLLKTLVFYDPVQHCVMRRARPADFAALPAHKTLFRAAPDCGLPIGNLTSQFFAKVYLDALDQFVKHRLKVRHYLRYCDEAHLQLFACWVRLGGRQRLLSPMEVAEMPATLAADFATLLRRLRQLETETSTDSHERRRPDGPLDIGVRHVPATLAPVPPLVVGRSQPRSCREPLVAGTRIFA